MKRSSRVTAQDLPDRLGGFCMEDDAAEIGKALDELNPRSGGVGESGSWRWRRS